MIERRAVVILSVLCALGLGAFAAPSAVALKGTTAFTCIAEPNPNEKTAGFEDEHCTKAVTGTKAKWVHKEIPVEPLLFTWVGVTNNETLTKTIPSKLKTTVGGMEFEAEAAAYTGCGEGKTWLANLENFILQMFASGRYCGEFTKVTVSKPAKCSIAGGAVKTEEAGFWGTEVALNKAKEEEMWTEFRPPVGEETQFAEFEITGGECPLKNKKVSLTGAARANVQNEKEKEPLGATLKFTTATTGETLKANGEKAEFQGTFTPRMLAEKAGEAENPITVTTTEK